jgi:hypothetical protein
MAKWRLRSQLGKETIDRLAVEGLGPTSNQSSPAGRDVVNIGDHLQHISDQPRLVRGDG